MRVSNVVNACCMLHQTKDKRYEAAVAAAASTGSVKRKAPREHRNEAPDVGRELGDPAHLISPTRGTEGHNHRSGLAAVTLWVAMLSKSKNITSNGHEGKDVSQFSSSGCVCVCLCMSVFVRPAVICLFLSVLTLIALNYVSFCLSFECSVHTFRINHNN